MSKDFKTGLLGLFIIIVLIVAIRFLRKANFFDTDNTIYAVFKTASGLELQNDVIIKGLRVGKVVKMEPADENLDGIKVSMKIDKDLEIPVNSVAFISKSALSASDVIIEKGNAKTYLENNDIVATKESDDALEAVKAQAKPLAQKIQHITDSLSMVLEKYNNKTGAAEQVDFKQRIADLNAKSAGFNDMTRRLNAKSITYLNQLRASSSAYRNREKQINQAIAGINKKAAGLNDMHLGNKVDSVALAIANLNRKIAAINSGKLGALSSDRKLYDSLDYQLLKTEIMLDDIRVHPKRYLNYSVLGKSEKPKEPESEAVKERRRQNVEFNRKQQERYKID